MAVALHCRWRLWVKVAAEATSMGSRRCQAARRGAHAVAMDHLGGPEVGAEAVVAAPVGAQGATAEEGVGEAAVVAVEAMAAVEEVEDQAVVAGAEGVGVAVAVAEGVVAAEEAAEEEVAVEMAGRR